MRAEDELLPLIQVVFYLDDDWAFTFPDWLDQQSDISKNFVTHFLYGGAREGHHDRAAGGKSLNSIVASSNSQPARQESSTWERDNE